MMFFEPRIGRILRILLSLMPAAFDRIHKMNRILLRLIIGIWSLEFRIWSLWVDDRPERTIWDHPRRRRRDALSHSANGWGQAHLTLHSQFKRSAS